MRLPSLRYVREQGSAYLSVLIVAMLVGIILTAYLKMVSVQNTFTMRSQAWNRSIAITEAGIEDALTHLYVNGTNVQGLYVDGWWNLGGQYYKRGFIDDCIYEVTISPELNPIIISRGYAPSVQNYARRKGFGPFLADVFWWGTRSDAYVYRTVRVTTVADGMFMKAMIAKHYIDLNGNNVRTDSFDSGDPRYSTNGLYYAPWARDNGDVATTSGLTNFVNIDVGNANIFGRVATGPNGSVTVGPNGAVGSAAWHNGGHQGIEPGFFRDDMNMNFPPVQPPFSSGYFTPSSGSVGGTNYTFVLGNGNYKSSSVGLSGNSRVLINGRAAWWITDSFSMSGNAEIFIAPNASLALFVGQSTGTGASGTISGNGIHNDSGYATNCIYYGLPSNTSLSYSGNAAFVGAIYAPNAAFSLNGGGDDTYDFLGASVTSSVQMNGHFNFHYDEALGRFGPRRGYIITSWNEI